MSLLPIMVKTPMESIPMPQRNEGSPSARPHQLGKSTHVTIRLRPKVSTAAIRGTAGEKTRTTQDQNELDDRDAHVALAADEDTDGFGVSDIILLAVSLICLMLYYSMMCHNTKV